MELLELTGSQWPKRRRLLAHPVISLLRSNRLRAKTVLAEQATPAEHMGLLRPIKIVFGPFESNVAGRSFKKASEVIPFGRRAFDILPTLLDWPGEIISKGDLIAKPPVKLAAKHPKFFLRGARRDVSVQSPS
jgi:hypothetical protein